MATHILEDARTKQQREIDDTMEKIHRVSDQIVKAQTKTKRTVGEALSLQRLQNQRRDLQGQLPRLRIVSSN